MLHRLVVLVSCFLTVVYCCQYNKDQKRAECKSFDEIKKAKSKDEWQQLSVGGSGEFVTVTRDAFRNVPNIDDLQIKGIADRISRGVLTPLSKLFQLHLDDNELRSITARNFENPSLEQIYIYNCKVDDIQPKAFENIPKLNKVFITGNSISTIRKGVFNNLKLELVYLRNNKIKYVESEAFSGMDKLSFLSLEENELTYFEPNIVIGYNPSLRSLYINRNQLSQAKREMFAGFPNLEILLININHIESLGEKSFVDLKKMWLLDLSHNLLEEIRPDVFPAQGNNIVKLFLHDNRLTYVSSGVLVRLNKLQQISATGNPWQCACQSRFRSWLHDLNVTRICDREVASGERPSCVIHPKQYKECVYDVENTREVVDYYEQIIKDYPPLPPVCETDGKDTPSLGSK